jgi:hypothetical protein
MGGGKILCHKLSEELARKKRARWGIKKDLFFEKLGRSLLFRFLFHARFEAGLPDFSCHNIPKQWKMDQLPLNYQMTIKYNQIAVIYSKWP